MFGSAILDVAIGLVFVYLLLSFIVTAAQELLETVIKLRAAHLAKGIEKLLGSDIAKQFFDNPMIKGLSPDKWFGAGTRKPSYIPSRAFAATVLDILARADVAGPRTLDKVRAGINNLKDDDLKKSLSVLLEEGQHKLETFETQLEGWFNGQMERVSGWYKRKAQLVTVAIGLVIAAGMNADSIAIVKTLSSDSSLRAALVAEAQERAKQPLASAGQIDEHIAAVQGSITKIQGLGLPIGFIWSAKRIDWAQAIPGWLLTAFAISLGAPFWFDMLNKVVSIRSSGRAPDEKPKA